MVRHMRTHDDFLALCDISLWRLGSSERQSDLHNEVQVFTVMKTDPHMTLDALLVQGSGNWIYLTTSQEHLVRGLPLAKKPLLARPRREALHPQQGRSSAGQRAGQGGTSAPVQALAS